MNSYTLIAIGLVISVVFSVVLMAIGLYLTFHAIKMANMRMPFSIKSLKADEASAYMLLAGLVIFVTGALLLGLILLGWLDFGLCRVC